MLPVSQMKEAPRGTTSMLTEEMLSSGSPEGEKESEIVPPTWNRMPTYTETDRQSITGGRESRAGSASSAPSTRFSVISATGSG